MPIAAPLLRPTVATSAAADAGAPFDGSMVRELARDLAAAPYQRPTSKLPDHLAKLDYDQYRDIRFKPAQSLWREAGLPFEVQFFHRGFIYVDRVEIYEVVGGRSLPIRYSSDMFDFGAIRPPEAAGLGFAGFRLHGAINRRDYYDEVASFLGASYFRAVGKNQTYGLSARGLAINTADPAGEEFPLFRSFWLERPQHGTATIVVHALLDSASASGAFRFTIRPGDDTIIDVESAIYPRVEIEKIGLAPLTSMFFFDPSDRDGIDDFRPAVHDSNGLAIWSGRGEQLWRPLANPKELQVSAFVDANLRGFGLMQRERRFHAYEDLEARYEARPSLWMEPIGDVGEGAVHLVEIPTKREIHDNVVAFWRPSQPVRAKSELIFNYRQHWCWERPFPARLARVVASRSGAAAAESARLFVIDIAGDELGQSPEDLPLAEIEASEGKVLNVVVQSNPEVRGWRISFELSPGGARLVELRARLLIADEQISETWLYRWTA